MSQSELQQKETIERKELNLIDVVQSEQPYQHINQTVDLGKRDFTSHKSSSKKCFTRDRRMKEEMGRTFLDQIYLEKEVEKLKCELAHRIDYTTMGAFTLFNYRGLESLSKAEFSESLFSYIGNSYYDRNQAYLVFLRYDQDYDQRLNYREFCRMIMPSDA